jgi:hypothetical protein
MKLFDLLALGKLKKEDLPPGVYRDKNGVLTLTWQAIINNKDNQAFPDKR